MFFSCLESPLFLRILFHNSIKRQPEQTDDRRHPGATPAAGGFFALDRASGAGYSVSRTEGTHQMRQRIPVTPVPERPPDVEAFFSFNDVRKSPARDGYRPAHRLTDTCLTTGVHYYIMMWAPCRRARRPAERSRSFLPRRIRIAYGSENGSRCRKARMWWGMQ